MRNFIPIIVILTLTSCIKQEVFEPKFNTGKDVLVAGVTLQKDKISCDLHLRSVNGSKTFLGPGEIDFMLVEDDSVSYRGVTSNTNGFMGFLGISQPKENSKYSLIINFAGNRMEYSTTFPKMEESITIDPIYHSNGNVTPTVYSPVLEEGYVYIAQYLDYLVFYNYQLEKENSSKFFHENRMKIQGSDKCTFFPYQDLEFKQSVFKVPVLDHKGLCEKVSRLDFASNPFIIPYTSRAYNKKENILGYIYAYNKVELDYTIFDKSEIASELKFVKDGKSIILKDSTYIPYEFQINRIDGGHHFRVGLFSNMNSTNNSIPVSYNKMLRDKCYLDNPVKENLPNDKMYVFAKVRNKSNQAFLTDTFYFTGQKIPREITLNLHD